MDEGRSGTGRNAGSDDLVLALLRDGPELLIICDGAGVVRFASSTLARASGPLVGRPLSDSGLPAEIVAPLEAQRLAVGRTGRADVIPIEIEPAGKRPLGFELAVEPLDERGAVALRLRPARGGARGRRDARASKGHYRLLAENSTDMISRHDPEGVYLYASPASRTILGYEPEALVGRSAYDLFHPDDREVVARSHVGVLESPEARTTTYRVRHEDGHYIWLETTARTLRDPTTGAVIEIQCASRDVTARRVAEDALRESEGRFRGAFDAAAVGMAVASPEGNFLEVNGSFREIVGYTEAELVGSNFKDITHPDDVQADLGNALALLDGRIPSYRLEKRYIHKRGHTIWVHLSVSLVRDAEGRPRTFVGLIEDVTPRKHAEERLQAQNLTLQDMAESERRAHAALKQAQVQLVQSEKLSALGQMVAGVAHEINNPLAFVTNDVAVLRRDAENLNALIGLYREADSILAERAPGLLERVREHADRIDLTYTQENLGRLSGRILEGLRRIRQIVRDLRDFARLDEGDLKEVDLNEGIAATLNVVRARASMRRVELATDLGPLPPIACYAGKINQVVLNLLVNAIDACPVGGRVATSTRAVDDRIEIEVADDGTGIPPAIRDKIFDPFFTTKPIGEGTGLGLSISYGIVQAHGGRIEVESTPGLGSRFTVILPAAPPADRPESG